MDKHKLFGTNPKKIPMRHVARGFTLAEIAIVIVITSILLAAGAKIMLAQLHTAAYQDTNQKQAQIRQALISYLGQYKRLPCPDVSNGNGPGPLSFSTAAPPDGVENRTVAGDPTSNCAASFGVLPYATLGLSRDDALDGWKNLYSYQLSVAPHNWARSASFADTAVGSLTVNDRDNAGANTVLASNAVAVVISHGQNGLGAFSSKGSRNALPNPGQQADEAENTNTPAGNTLLYQRAYNTNSAFNGGAYDDVVNFVTAQDLIAPLRRDGSLGNMNVLATQQLDGFKDAVVGFMMGAGCNTPSTLSSLGLNTQDPWGTTIAYTSAYTTAPQKVTASDINLNPSGSASSQALLLRSSGANRISGDADDVTLSLTIGQLRGLLGTAYATRCP